MAGNNVNNSKYTQKKHQEKNTPKMLLISDSIAHQIQS